MSPFSPSEIPPISASVGSLDRYPAVFRDFLSKNDIDPREYEDHPPIPRYLRVNVKRVQASHTGVLSFPNEDVSADIADQILDQLLTSDTTLYKNASSGEISKQFKLTVEKLSWLSPDWQLYAVSPGDFPVGCAEIYRTGLVYGCDAASAVAVEALLKNPLAIDLPVISVLDLCCAPGQKFCGIADRLLALKQDFQLVGVDVSRERLSACDSVVAKYMVGCEQYLRLELADGTKWKGEAGWKQAFSGNICGTKNARKKQMRGAKRRKIVDVETMSTVDKKSITETDEKSIPVSSSLFDLVLVDAECSHEGSVKHISKYLSHWKTETMGEKMKWLSEECESLEKLQLGLLRNGARNLKRGGKLVYSTCSYSTRQNEGLVQKFLKEAENMRICDDIGFDANLVPCEFITNSTAAVTGVRNISSEKGMARFSPAVSKTSGLFVAKLEKT